MANNYDIIVVGSGPGGYVTAIRASQLGFKTAVVERESLGGICLNWGCIPTKALIKSAQVLEYMKHSTEYGIEVGDIKVDFPSVIKRSRGVAEKMSGGIGFLMKKNKIDVIQGEARLKVDKKIDVKSSDGKVTEYSAPHIILATGSRSKELPNLPQDGKNIIGYREALSLKKLPKNMVVVGSGAIGVEFAYFYHAMGVDVTVVEFQSDLLPNEDKDVSKSFKSTFEKWGIKAMTNSSVESVDKGGKSLKVNVKTSKGMEVIETDIVLSAVGIKSNIESIGLEEVDIAVDKKADKVIVDDYYKTNIPGYYAIGDIVKTHALAHVASAEGITCVEKIKGMEVDPIDYGNIPGCTYSYPQVASVGMTEKIAKEKGYDLKIGKFPFTASGKATAGGAIDGFVKVIFDAKYGELLGCHMIGDGVTEMIAEAVVARKLETTGHEMLKAIHPHPTMSEAVMEAVAAAYDEVIHI